MKQTNKIKTTNSVTNSYEEDYFKELKAEIAQGKLDYKEGNFISHEEMLLELKNKKNQLNP